MTAGRNDPCPCGSGRKYKKCHLAADQASRAAEAHHDVSPLHELDNRLSEEMMAFASSRFPEGLDVPDEFESLDPAAGGFQFLVPWALYVAPVRGRPIVDWFLESRAWSLTPGQLEWIEAQRKSWVSIWEVLEVDRGRGFRVRDLLSLEERFVHEVKGSQTAQPRLAMLCRVVDASGTSVIAGTHPQPLPPSEAARAVRHIRAVLRKKGAVGADLLRQSEVASLVAHEFDIAVQKIRRRDIPHLQNTDGDELSLTVDRYRFAPSRRGEIEAALASIEDMERDPESGAFLFIRPEKRRKDRFTILGTVTVSADELRAETNSLERASALQIRIEHACGTLLGKSLRSHMDPRSEIGRRAAAPLPEHSEEEAEVIRRIKSEHYEQWLRDPIPALGGKTPRQAARSKRGREQLEALLKDMEYHESLLPQRERFDVSVLRVKLRLT